MEEPGSGRSSSVSSDQSDKVGMYLLLLLLIEIMIFDFPANFLKPTRSNLCTPP